MSTFGFLCLLALSIVQGGDDDDLQGCHGKNGSDSGYNPMVGGDDDVLQRRHGKNSSGSGHNPMGGDDPDVLATGMVDACNVSSIDDQLSFTLTDYEQKEVIPSKMQAGSISEEQPFPVTDAAAGKAADGPTIGQTILLPTITTVWVMIGIVVFISIFRSIVLYSSKDVPDRNDSTKDVLEEEESEESVVNPEDVETNLISLAENTVDHVSCS